MVPVLITGLGVVSCVGRGTDALWRGMLAGTSTPRRVADPLGRMRLPLLYTVADEDSPSEVDEPGSLGRTSGLAVDAATQALADAGLEPGSVPRLAVVVGTGMGDTRVHERRPGRGAPRRDGPSPFGVGSVVGRAVGSRSATSTISNACAASGFAIAMASDLIRAGDADVVLAGGAEGYSRVALGCFNRLGAIDEHRCRPFDVGRNGTVFGEGAAMLILESADHAARRGAATVHGAVLGSGWSCDAHHVTAPEPTGEQIARAVRGALADGGTVPAAVSGVVPHGTGTALNDVVESRVLGQVLDTRADEVPVYSLKALVGHTGGAAAALAAVAACLLLRHRAMPANVPIDQDPRCDVWLPQAETALDAGLVLVNAYAFGGNNVSLLLAGAA